MQELRQPSKQMLQVSRDHKGFRVKGTSCEEVFWLSRHMRNKQCSKRLGSSFKKGQAERRLCAAGLAFELTGS